MAKYISKTQKIWEKEDDKDPMSLLNVARKYFKWREVHNYSKRSVKTIRHYLGKFITWCDEVEIIIVTDVSKEIMHSYKLHLQQELSLKKQEKLSFDAQNKILSAVCSFFTWATKAEYFITSPCEEIRYYKRNKRLPRNVLTPEEVEKVLNKTNISTPKGIRDRAIMEMLYSSGIRRSEIAGLKVQDVDIAKGLLLIREGKGQKDRLIPIGERAVKWLIKYLQEVRSQIVKKPTEDTLFLTVHGKAIVSPGRYNNLVRDYMNAAEIKGIGACHLFRHAMATAMLENGADIRYIKECLGHAELSTTDIYTSVTISSLKEVHNRTHPTSKQDEIVSCENKNQKPLPSFSSKEKETKPHPFWQEYENHPLVVLTARFLDSMKVNGSKPSYLVSTSFYLRGFMEWCVEREIENAQTIDRKILSLFENYMYYQKKKSNGEPLSTISRIRCITAIKIFMRWLVTKKYIATNPAESIEYPKVPKRIPRYVPSYEEIEKIMALPNTSTTIGIRDRAIFETLYSTGIRRGEILRLTISDISFSRETMLIRDTKTNKDRVVPIGKRALNWIIEYIDKARDYLVKGEEDTLFISGRGRPFSRDSLSEIILDYLTAAGLHKHRGACHIFRHAMATHMLSEGADIRYIKEILGHVKLSTTEIYTKVSIEKLKEVHTNTHPAKMYPTKTEQVFNELEQDSNK